MSTATTTSSAATEAPSVPAGKVGCLLCGGFISVQGGDRARFVDHMSNEHDAKTECQDVLLALCVLDTKERGFIVKSAGPRLEEIGKGQSPNYSNSFLTKLAPVSTPTNQPPPSFRPRQPAPSQHRRGAGGASFRPMARQPRPQHMMPLQAPPRPPQPPVNVPSALQGNVSISISKVDITRKCSMCSDILPNPAALVQHMNTDHFTRLGGINIVTKADHEAKKSEYQERTAQHPVQVQTPSAYTIPKQPTNQWSGNRSSPIPVTSRPITSQISRTLPNNMQRMSMVKPQSPAQGFKRKQPVETVKCNICAKTVEKSKLSVHKLSHAQDRKNEKVNMIRTNQKNKAEESLKLETATARKVEEVELIELENDESDVNDKDIANPTKTVGNSPLPHDRFKQGDKTSGGDVQCKICDKKLASNMALKMHNNLKHPVKKEVDDAEMLLKEDEDKSKESDVKNEIDKMETLELLDNLVNFLNDA